ncbi:MAG: hypothetical protein Q8M98_04300 [Candidatus Cloacimonadaceae bacterium]|nr:hypothetical protein [Candidatus Cloacimonadaceae bacterium]MDP3113980.1 hypothetical protein [Candidatus Cloacimonadaceae bacterium]
MLEALAAKALALMASLSMFLFSSYSGNDPSLSVLRGVSGKSYLQLETRLIGAFENDFVDVFKSGAPIPVNYTVEIRSKGKIKGTRAFSNVVRYDSRSNSYKIIQSGSGRTSHTSSYQTMLEEVSLLECSLPIETSWGEVKVRLETWLPTVHFDQIDRRVDLIVLWKFRRPSVSAVFDLRRLS